MSVMELMIPGTIIGAFSPRIGAFSARIVVCSVRARVSACLLSYIYFYIILVFMWQFLFDRGFDADHPVNHPARGVFCIPACNAAIETGWNVDPTQPGGHEPRNNGNRGGSFSQALMSQPMDERCLYISVFEKSNTFDCTITGEGGSCNMYDLLLGIKRASVDARRRINAEGMFLGRMLNNEDVYDFMLCSNKVSHIRFPAKFISSIDEEGQRFGYGNGSYLNPATFNVLGDLMETKLSPLLKIPSHTCMLLDRLVAAFAQLDGDFFLARLFKLSDVPVVYYLRCTRQCGMRSMVSRSTCTLTSFSVQPMVSLQFSPFVPL